MEENLLPNSYLKVILSRRPKGLPKKNDFSIVSAPMPLLEEGQLLVRSHYLSADPFQRMRLDSNSKYGKTLELGDTIKGRVVGEVIQSKNKNFEIGEYVEGMLGWQEFCISDGSKTRAEYAPGISKVDPSIAPISTSLGILGFPGITAYFSLLIKGSLKKGETVVVSAAGGAVGTIAGQIAKINGCKVIGITGTDKKCKFLTEQLKFDGTINYKKNQNITSSILKLAPGGVDIFLDNTGGEIADSVYQTLCKDSRVVLVGNISQNNITSQKKRLDFQNIIMRNRTTISGFIVYDFENKADIPRIKISNWMKKGLIKNFESIELGIENAPGALISMLNGENIGKQIIRLPISELKNT